MGAIWGLNAIAQVPDFLQSLQYRSPNTYAVLASKYTRSEALVSNNTPSGDSYSLSGILTKYRPTKKDLRRAEKESVAAAEAGDMDEIYFRIRKFSDANNATERDYWIKKAALYGDANWATYAVRYLFLTGQEKEQICRRAFLRGNAEIAGYAANIFWRENNWSMAMSAEERVAENSPWHYVRVAELYLTSDAPWHDSTKAIKMLELGAERGHEGSKQILHLLQDTATREFALWSLKNEVLDIDTTYGWILGRELKYSAPSREGIEPRFFGSHWLTDLDGKLLIKHPYSSISVIGRNVLSVYENGKNYFVDGRAQRISPIYDDIEYSIEGPIRVRRGHLWSFVSRDAKTIGSQEFLYASKFERGLATVWDGQHCYRINEKGETVGEKKQLILEQKYGEIKVKDFPEIKLKLYPTYVKDLNVVLIPPENFPSKCPFGMIDKKRRWIVPPEYIYHFYDQTTSTYVLSKGEDYFDCSKDGKITPR